MRIFAREMGKRGKKAIKKEGEYEDEVESKGRISTLIHGKRKEGFCFLSPCVGPLLLEINTIFMHLMCGSNSQKVAMLINLMGIWDPLFNFSLLNFLN